MTTASLIRTALIRASASLPKLPMAALSTVALAATLLAPAAAVAKSGYMTCQLHREAVAGAGGTRTYYTYPFEADSADEDVMTAKFQKVSIASGTLQSTDPTLGGCHWEAKKSAAFNVVKGFMAKYPGNEFDFSRALALEGK